MVESNVAMKPQLSYSGTVCTSALSNIALCNKPAL